MKPDDTRQKIKAILAARGWTIRQLAERLGTSVRTAEGWLYGRQASRLAESQIQQLHDETP